MVRSPEKILERPSFNLGVVQLKRIQIMEAIAQLDAMMDRCLSALAAVDGARRRGGKYWLLGRAKEGPVGGPSQDPYFFPIIRAGPVEAG